MKEQLVRFDRRGPSVIHRRATIRRRCMKTVTKLLIALIILGIVDMVVPVPIIGITLIYVVLQKPLWFRVVVDEIYRN